MDQPRRKLARRRKRNCRRSEAALGFRCAGEPPVPSVSKPDWVRTPVDGFVLAKLDRESLAPSPEDDRVTLLRRLSLDLIGLPPNIDEVNRFVADKIRTLMRSRWSVCLPRLTMASAGGASGWMEPAMPIRMVSRRMPRAAFGSIAIG